MQVQNGRGTIGVNFLFNHPLGSQNSCHPSFLSRVSKPSLGVHPELSPWASPASPCHSGVLWGEWIPCHSPRLILSILEDFVGTPSALSMPYSLYREAGPSVIKLAPPSLSLCSYLTRLFLGIVNSHTLDPLFDMPNFRLLCSELFEYAICARRKLPGRKVGREEA